ncbi:MAG: hypothetical protein WCK47_00195 [bacterium]
MSADQATSAPLAFDASRGGGVFGPTIAVDPGFDYYKEHPLPDICRAIRQQGFTAAQLIWTGVTATTSTVLRKYADAMRAADVTPVLRIYPPTDLQLYQDHPEWRQLMLGGADGKFDWRTYLCPNKPEFVKAYCDRVEDIMRDGGFDAIQLAEVWWEQWGGPEETPGKPRAAYACVCDACVKKFRRISGADARDMLTSVSSRWYWRKPENAALYSRWVDFRVQTIQEFAEAIISAARRGHAGANISITYLADARVEADASREYQGIDLNRMVVELKPDIITLEDSWQDWCQPELKPDFVADYARAYRDRIKRLNPGICIMSHADIGSSPASKRSPQWIRAFAAETVKNGFGAPSFYEWSISTLK